jgi:hypothetical protein
MMKSRKSIWLIFIIIGSLLWYACGTDPNNNEISDVSLEKICPMLTQNSGIVKQPTQPFAVTSIWRRQIPLDAVYADVQNAIFGDVHAAPARIGTDLVTIGYTNDAMPLTNIEKSQDWNYPGRSESSGVLLYQRHLGADTCGCVNWKRNGNALFVLINPVTFIADIGVGGWRIFEGPLLNVANDGVPAHNIDVINGDGLGNYGRGSGLPPLGGLIRLGELNAGINHAVSIAMISSRFSSANHFRWPAASADSYAEFGYNGPDPNYTIGTLLAIPKTVDLNSLTWNTNQGLILAQAAQAYGFYIVDSSVNTGDLMNLAIEDQAARFDLGLAVDPDTSFESVDPLLIDIVGFTQDVMQIMHQVQAVTSNSPHVP